MFSLLENVLVQDRSSVPQNDQKVPHAPTPVNFNMDSSARF